MHREMNFPFRFPAGKLSSVAFFLLATRWAAAFAVAGNDLQIQTTTKTPIKLQAPHPTLSPAETMRQLAYRCEELTIQDWDTYGDFHLSSEGSFLRKFEAEVAHEFEKEDAVFVPSGVMAQSIALLIHSKNKEKMKFICHATSHLLLHEQDGYSELCGMKAISLPRSVSGTGLGASPLLFSHVDDLFASDNTEAISTLILELPHRELGGKLTPWQDICQMSLLCREREVALHCDGARIFEASTGYEMDVADLARPFDSIYISFYKGLGGVSGAMLLGSKDFCGEARIWMRRFGGNLYTLLPYVVSGWAGYKKNWILPKTGGSGTSFIQKKKKLRKIAAAMAQSGSISDVLAFEPQSPEVNMVHCYLRMPIDDATRIRDVVENELGVSVFHRLRPVLEKDGFRSCFELSIGEANFSIPDSRWIEAWSRFAEIAGSDQA